MKNVDEVPVKDVKEMIEKAKQKKAHALQSALESTNYEAATKILDLAECFGQAEIYLQIALVKKLLISKGVK